jgi:hypothetical protein
MKFEYKGHTVDVFQLGEEDRLCQQKTVMADGKMVGKIAFSGFRKDAAYTNGFCNGFIVSHVGSAESFDQQSAGPILRTPKEAACYLLDLVYPCALSSSSNS